MRSRNLGAWYRRLYSPTSQRVLLVCGDSIHFPNSSTTAIPGWRDRFRVPWNGWNIHAGSGVADIGYTNFTVGTSAGVTGGTVPVNPGGTFTGGLTAISPVYGHDAVYSNGSMGAGKFSESVLLYDLIKYNRTPNYVSNGATINHRRYIYDGANMLPSVAVVAARNAGAVNTVVWTKGTPTNAIVAVDAGNTTSGIYPGTEYRGNGATAGPGANNVIDFGSSLRVSNTVGVHWHQPIAIGGWTSTSHVTTSNFTNAALDNWFNVSFKPTEIVQWCNQNITAGESTELNAGTITTFYNNQLAMAQRYEGSLSRLGAAAPNILFVVNYKTGYDAIVYRTIERAFDALCNLSPRYSYINLYELCGEENFSTAAYTADGVHPNAAGAQFIMSRFDDECRTQAFGALPRGGRAAAIRLWRV